MRNTSVQPNQKREKRLISGNRLKNTRLGGPFSVGPTCQSLRKALGLPNSQPITVPLVVTAAEKGDYDGRAALNVAVQCLAQAITHVVTLLCPRRIIIGGGVALVGEKWFFAPLREAVTRNVFKPFAGLTDIVPAALGEAVVVHGALALARQRLAR